MVFARQIRSSRSLLAAIAALAVAFGSWRSALAFQDAPPTPGSQAPPAEVAEHTAEAVGEFRPSVLRVEESRNLAKSPESVSELLDLESRIREVVQKVLPATVGLIIGQGQGSGVIVSPDGYVLTAAHVAGRPGSRVIVIMPDGRRYRGVSLGVNRGLDDGLVKITDREATDLPHAPLGSADELPLGTWTVALGHPGGYQQDRPPVVRVGRILARSRDFVLTDNTLVGGDSGGPLFDLDGRVIGIHSRIEGNITRNVHVPSDRFIDDWEQLLASREWGGMMPDWMRGGPAADDGLRFDPDPGEGGARIVRIIPESPGERAGLQLNDRVTAINDKPVTNGQDVMLRRSGLKPNEPAVYTIRRGEETLKVEITPISPQDLRQPSRRSDPQRPVLGIEIDFSFFGPGTRLAGVAAGGPAEKAGLQAGDVLLGYNGQLLRNPTELSELMARGNVGETVRLTVRRDAQDLNVELVLGAYGQVYPDGQRGR